MSLSPLTTQLAFLGAGRMAHALIKGFLKSAYIAPNEIIVSSKSHTSAQQLANLYHVQAALSNEEAIAAAPVIFLCMKPTQVLSILSENTPLLKGKLLISVVAGIPAEALFQAAGKHARIIRTMPNTAVRLEKGATTIAPHPSATLEDLALVQKLLNAVGKAYQIEETVIDATTAVSGSGPAFALLFLEGLMQGGIDAGLDPTLARTLAAHALQGAAALILETDTTPQALRAEIASPRGTTEAGLHALEQEGLFQATQHAIKAAVERAHELASKNS